MLLKLVRRSGRAGQDIAGQHLFILPNPHFQKSCLMCVRLYCYSSNDLYLELKLVDSFRENEKNSYTNKQTTYALL